MKKSSPNSGWQQLCLPLQSLDSLELQSRRECNRKIRSSELTSSQSQLGQSKRTTPTSLLVRKTITVGDAGRAIGEDHVNAKYLDEDVARVFCLRAQGLSYSEIGKIMDMPVRTLRDYLAGRRRNQSVAGWKVVVRRVAK